LSDYLKHFLEQNLPKSKDKKSKNQLGVSEEKLAAAITETLSTPCTRGGTFERHLPALSLEITPFSLSFV
jgi:hypothetical protein